MTTKPAAAARTFTSLGHRRARWLVRAARWMLAVVLALWLALGLTWALLHVLVVPQVERFTPALERWAASALGAPVRLGAVRAAPDGLFPTISLHELAVLDARGHTALVLDRVDVVVSARSLLRLGLEQLIVDAPALQVRRLLDGRWTVAGVDASADDSAAQTPRALQWLLQQPQLLVRRARLHVVDERQGQAALELHGLDITLHGGRARRHLQLDATLLTQANAPSVGLHINAELHRPLLDAALDHALQTAAQGARKLRPSAEAPSQPTPSAPELLDGWSGQLFLRIAAPEGLQAAPQWMALLEEMAQPTGVQGVHVRGQLRAWLDIEHGLPSAAVLDMALDELGVHWADAQIQPLQLRSVQGRLRSQWQPHSLSVQTQGLGFTVVDATTRQQLVWPVGNWSLQQEWTSPTATSLAQQWHFSADHVDVGAAAALVRHVTVPAQWTAQMPPYVQDPTWQVRGQLRDVSVLWAAPSGHAQQQRSTARFEARGALTGFAVQHLSSPQPSSKQPNDPSGVWGLNAQFDVHEAGGQAQLHMDAGAVALPDVFEHARIPIERLDAQLQWVMRPEGGVELEINHVRFANAHAAGELRAHWHTPNLATDPAGTLQLHGSLHRAHATQVHRYLPLALPQEVRHYVRDAITAGHSHDVRFEVRGPLADFPFADGQKGRFFITAALRGVGLDYMPSSLRDGEPPWPAVEDLDAQLSFEGLRMDIADGRARFADAPTLRIEPVYAAIANLEQPVLTLHALSSGRLDQMLAIARAGAVDALLSGALQDVRGSGAAVLELDLQIPINTPQATQVVGNVHFSPPSLSSTLGAVALQWSPQAPRVEALRGSVRFTENGFELQGVQGRALDAPWQFSGGLNMTQQPQTPDTSLGKKSPGWAPIVHIHARGTASAAALAQESALPQAVRSLAQQLKGQSLWSVQIQVPMAADMAAGASAEPTLSISSDLRGLSLPWPAPLHKPEAHSALPLRMRLRFLPQQRTHMHLELHERAWVEYEWVSTHARAQVLRGHIHVDMTEDSISPPVLSAHGVGLSLRMPELNADAWLALLAQLQRADDDLAPSSADPNAQLVPDAMDWPASSLTQWLPTRLALDVDRLHVADRELSPVHARLVQVGHIWGGHVSSRFFAGQLQHHGPSPSHPNGLLHARLQHLHIPRERIQQLQDAHTLADSTRIGTIDKLPDLDVQVGDLRADQSRLGALTLLAHNRAAHSAAAQQHWQLERLELNSEHAQLKAHGSWTPPTPASPNPNEQRGQTDLQLELAMHNTGAMLRDLGLPDTIAHGSGHMHGRLRWAASPLTPHWPSMDGSVRLHVERGQFLKVQPGAAKLLSVLSLQSIARRLTLDFSDVFAQGFAFDQLTGDVRINSGQAFSENLQMRGLAATVHLSGSADLEHETQQLRVVVHPHISATGASLAAVVLNPVLGLGTLLAQTIFGASISEAATRTFEVSGSWFDPTVQPVPTTAPQRTQ